MNEEEEVAAAWKAFDFFHLAAFNAARQKEQDEGQEEGMQQFMRWHIKSAPWGADPITSSQLIFSLSPLPLPRARLSWRRFDD